MNRNQRRSRLTFVLLGSSLVGILAVAPASAALSGGSFFVHAQNTDDPTIDAVAGHGGLQDGSGSNPGGTNPDDGGSGGENGGTNPGNGEQSGATTIKAGPLSLSVTDEMLAFSEANRKAQEEGRTGDIKTHAGGWQRIWSYDAPENTMVPGLVGMDNDTALMVLMKNSTEPLPNSVASGIPGDDVAYRFFRTGRQSDYQVHDFRNAPKAGDVYSYATNGSYSDDPSRNYYAESRYLSEDGSLVGVTVAKQADGRTTVSRSANPRVYPSYSRSDTKPYNLAFTDGKPSDMSILLKSARAGYNQIQIQAVGDEFQVFYRTYKGQTDNGQDDMPYGTRTDGPVTLSYDSSGKITSAGYRDRDGEVQYISGPLTVAEYNQKSGQNWDGKYPKYSDFDLAFPFQATKP